jgi:hypothetical protein
LAKKIAAQGKDVTTAKAQESDGKGRVEKGNERRSGAAF